MKMQAEIGKSDEDRVQTESKPTMRMQADIGKSNATFKKFDQISEELLAHRCGILDASFEGAYAFN